MLWLVLICLAAFVAFVLYILTVNDAPGRGLDLPRLPHHMEKFGGDMWSTCSAALDIEGVEVSYERNSSHGTVEYRWNEDGTSICLSQEAQRAVEIWINGSRINKETQKKNYDQVILGVTPFINKIYTLVEEKQREAYNKEQKKIKERDDVINQLFPDFSKITDVGELAEYLVSDNARLRSDAATRYREIKKRG